MNQKRAKKVTTVHIFVSSILPVYHDYLAFSMYENVWTLSDFSSSAMGRLPPNDNLSGVKE